ncbi:MAG: TrmH family RNA methyltransferase [Pseudonocardiaceae bacterium]
MVSDIEAMLLAISRGQAIVFLPAAGATSYPRPGVTYVDVVDPPPSTAALGWLPKNRDRPIVGALRWRERVDAVARFAGGRRVPDEIVTSLKDERVATVRTLTTRSGRSAAGLCVVEGRTLIEQVFAAGFVPVVVLRAEGAGTPEDDGLAAGLSRAGVSVCWVRDGVLRKVAGLSRPVAWWAGVRLPGETNPAAPWGEFAVVFEGVADPGNLGTLLRSARALGVEGVVLTDPHTDLWSRRVLDTSRGAALGIRTRRYNCPRDAVAGLRAAGFQIVATSPRGRQLQGLAELDGRPVALIVGGETAGVSTETAQQADLLLAIPMAGAIESLNVGVAAGIGIYELRTKMVLAMLSDRIRGTVGRDVAVTGRFIRAALDQAMQQAAGLSSEQVIALMVVTAERRTAAGELGRDLGVAAAELDTLLAPLLDRGWLTIDERTYAATLVGEQALATLWPVQQQVEQQLLNGLTAAERQTLRDLLRRVQSNAMSTDTTPGLV